MSHSADLSGSFDFTHRQSTGSLSSGYHLFRKKSISIKVSIIEFPVDASLNERLSILCNKLLSPNSRNEEETIVFQVYCFKEIFYLLTEIKNNDLVIDNEPHLLCNGTFISVLLEFFKTEDHIQDKNTLKLQFHALKVLSLLQSRKREYSDIIVAEKGISILIGFLRIHNSHHAHALSVEVQDLIVVLLHSMCSLDRNSRDEMVECRVLNYIYKLCILLRIHYDSLGKGTRSPRKSLAEWLDLKEKALIRSAAALFSSLCQIHRDDGDHRFLEYLSIELKVTKIFMCCSDSALQKSGAIAFAAISDVAYDSFTEFEGEGVDALKESTCDLVTQQIRIKMRRWSRSLCSLCIYAKGRCSNKDGKAIWVENADFLRARDSTLKMVLDFCLDHDQESMRTLTALALLRNKNHVLRSKVSVKLEEMLQRESNSKHKELIGDEVIECLLKEGLVADHGSETVISESARVLSQLLEMGLGPKIVIEREGVHFVVKAIQIADQQGSDHVVICDLLTLLLKCIGLDSIEKGLVIEMMVKGNGFEIISNLEHRKSNLEIAQSVEQILALKPQ